MAKKLLIPLDNFDYSNFSPNEYQIIHIVGKDKTPLEKIKLLRSQIHPEVIIGSKNWEHQLKKFYIKAIFFLARSKKKYILEENGKTHTFSISNIFCSGIKFIFEIILTKTIFQKLNFRSNRLIKKPKPTPHFDISKIKNISYLRTDYLFDVKVGGSIGHISGVINALIKKGFNLTYHTIEKTPGLSPKAKVKIIKHNKFYNNIDGLPPIIYHRTYLKKLLKLSTRNKPDLIYERFSTFSFVGVELSRKFKVPFILEFNGSEVWAAENWGDSLPHHEYARKIEQVNFKNADLIVVVSNPIKEQLIAQGVPAEKILMHPNCIDPDKFNPKISGSKIRKEHKLEEKIIVGFIGTFGRWHGVEKLAATIKPLSEKIPNIHFLIIGDGQTRPEVEAIIKRDKVEKFVTLTGKIPQDQAPEYLAACDILTAPTTPNPDGSKFFGSPTKLFEYMGLGKAIVASKIDQVGQILHHNKSALLTNPSDTKDLSEKIAQLAKNPSLRKKLGENAHKEVISKYTWDKNVEALLQKLKQTYPQE